MIFLTVLLLLLAGCMLINSQVSLSYANLGLELWFQKMIPALGPFMILSGIMVRLNLTEKAALAACPVVKPLYRVRENVVYAMVCGFLCGFPMGAKVVEDLYTRQRITRREAEYLLAFCNNIGPIYFVSFVLPLLGRKLVAPYLLGMYGIPLLYGLLLRWTVYRDLNAPRHSGESSSRRKKSAELVCCETLPARRAPSLGEKLLEETDSAIHASVQSLLSLGGYMILFNLLNLLPHMALGRPLTVSGPCAGDHRGFKTAGGRSSPLQLSGPVLWRILLPGTDLQLHQEHRFIHPQLPFSQGCPYPADRHILPGMGSAPALILPSVSGARLCRSFHWAKYPTYPVDSVGASG